MLEYECPICRNELTGSFGDDVTYKDCDVTFETDYEYVDFDSISSWIVGHKIEMITKEEFAKQFIEAVKGEMQPKRDHKICLFVSPTIDESCTKTVILFDPLNSKLEKQ